MKSVTFAALLSLAVLGLAQGDRPEADYYRIVEFRPPDGAVLEAGGLGFLPDGRLVVSTRRGQVWIIENPLSDDPAAMRYTLFAEGLQEGLGLEIVDGQIFVLQRAELSRLVDVDGDGVCDRIDTIANDWGVSGNYHEFAFGLPHDAAGNFYFSLNVSFFSPKWWHGKSPVPYRGWVMKATPEGKVEPVAPGFRSPCGLGMNTAGDLFVTDNQGDWLPACPVYHVVPGRFYGHPAGLDWTPEWQAAGRKATDTDPPDVRRAPAAMWLPYAWSRSTGNLVADDTKGKFGPFADQLFITEMTNGQLLRGQLEKVGGEYQGAAFRFHGAVGSAVRARFAPDGSLIIGRTERGWGGQAPGDGLCRMVFTGKVPFEIETVHLLPDGFELRFTEAPASLPDAAGIDALLYDYNWWWEYGSPEQRTRHLPVRSVEKGADDRTVVVKIDGLRPGKVLRLSLPALASASGRPLLHPEFAYTINQMPGAEPSTEQVAKLVPTPRPRERDDEGYVLLTEGDHQSLWKGEGWSAVEVGLKSDDRSRLEARGNPKEKDGKPSHHSTLVKLDPTVGDRDLICGLEHQAVQLWFDFMLPEGGEGVLYLLGRYGMRLVDRPAGSAPDVATTGALAPGARWKGRAPNFTAYRGAGQWHNLSVFFVPPRFDENGKKISGARFDRVRMDDVLLHEAIEVPEPSGDAPLPDDPDHGPLVLRCVKGGIAFRNLSFKLTGLPIDDAGWEPIFDGQSIEGWKSTDGARWTVEDGCIVGRGPSGHLFSPRSDYRNFEWRAFVKINSGGNSGMYFRTAFGPGWPKGYEAQVNSNHPDPQRTGGLYGIVPNGAMLVRPDCWFRQTIRCRDTEEGVHVIIKVNDVTIVDTIDRERRFQSGHLALQQHHEGSEVRYRDLEVREID